MQPEQGWPDRDSVAPRRWQATFLAAHAATAGRDFLLVATPGAGKTLAACEAARSSGCDQVIVVCPTTALRARWADAADGVGLHLDPRWRNADGSWRAEVDEGLAFLQPELTKLAESYPQEAERLRIQDSVEAIAGLSEPPRQGIAPK